MVACNRSMTLRLLQNAKEILKWNQGVYFVFKFIHYFVIQLMFLNDNIELKENYDNIVYV